MALLWGVLMKEESQKRALDSAQGSRVSSASVFFRGTKVGTADWSCATLLASLMYLSLVAFLLNRLVDLTAAHPGVPAPPHWPVRSVAHGLAG